MVTQVAVKTNERTMENFSIPAMKADSRISLKINGIEPAKVALANFNSSGKKRAYNKPHKNQLVVVSVKFSDFTPNQTRAVKAYDSKMRLRLFDQLETISFKDTGLSVASLSILQTRIAKKNEEFPVLSVSFDNCTLPRVPGAPIDEAVQLQWIKLFTAMQKTTKKYDERLITLGGHLRVTGCAYVNAAFLAFVVGMCHFETISIQGDASLKGIDADLEYHHSHVGKWLLDNDPFRHRQGESAAPVGLKSITISDCPMTSLPCMLATKSTESIRKVPIAQENSEYARRLVSYFRYTNNVSLVDMVRISKSDAVAISQEIQKIQSAPGEESTTRFNIVSNT